MNKVQWREVAMHAATQIALAAGMAALAAAGKVDWSQFGSYGAYAPILVAAITSIFNQATGPK